MPPSLYRKGRERVLRGIDILANAVKVTLAPRAATSCSTRGSGRRGSARTA